MQFFAAHSTFLGYSLLASIHDEVSPWCGGAVVVADVIVGVVAVFVAWAGISAGETGGSKACAGISAGEFSLWHRLAWQAWHRLVMRSASVLVSSVSAGKASCAGMA